MKRSPSRVALTVVILVVAVVSGCGGGGGGGAGGQTVVSKAEYERRIDAVGSNLFLWFSDLRQIYFYSQDLNGAGRDEVAAQIELIQKRMREQADALKGVTPPEDAKAAHDELIDALRDYADALDGWKKANYQPSESFVKAGQRFTVVGQKFEKLGYPRWLSEDEESPLCSSRATYSWPNAPFCTK